MVRNQGRRTLSIIDQNDGSMNTAVPQDSEMADNEKTSSTEAHSSDANMELELKFSSLSISTGDNASVHSNALNDSNLSDDDEVNFISGDDDDENMCPDCFNCSDDGGTEVDESEFGLGSDTKFDDKYDNSMKKQEGEILWKPFFVVLPILVLQRILFFMSPDDYGRDHEYHPDYISPPWAELANLISNHRNFDCAAWVKKWEDSHQPRGPWRPHLINGHILAPQVLRLNKRLNNHLTETYFGQGPFPAFIHFSGNMPSRSSFPRPFRKNPGRVDDLILEEYEIVEPILSWHRVIIEPSMPHYPLSFDMVKTLHLYIAFTHTNLMSITVYREGLRRLAAVFEPRRAPNRLETLVLKLRMTPGRMELDGEDPSRWTFNDKDGTVRYGNRGYAARKIPPGVMELVEPFMIFKKDWDAEKKVFVDSDLKKVEVEIDKVA